MELPSPKEVLGNFVSNLPASALGAIAAAEGAHIVGAEHQVVQWAAYGGLVLGGALSVTAERLGSYINRPPQE